MLALLKINEQTFPAARFGDIASLLNIILPLLIIGAALVFLILMFWAGYTYMTAGGNKDQVAQARKIIMYSILGLAIIAVSYLAVRIIQVMFNIRLPNGQYPL